MYSRDHRTLFFPSQLSKRTCSSFLFFIDNLLFLKIYMELRSKSGFIKGGVRFTKKVVKQTWEKQCLKDIVEWGGDFSYPLIIPVFLFFFNLVNVLYPLKVGHQSPFMKNQSEKNPLWLKFWLWGSMSDPNMFHVLSATLLHMKWLFSHFEKISQDPFHEEISGNKAQHCYPIHVHHPPPLIPSTEDLVTCGFIFKGLTLWQMIIRCMSYGTLNLRGRDHLSMKTFISSSVFSYCLDVSSL